MTCRPLSLALAVGFILGSLAVALLPPAHGAANAITVDADRVDYVPGMSAVATANISYNGLFSTVDNVRFELNDFSGVVIDFAYVRPLRIDNKVARATHTFLLPTISEPAYVNVSVNDTVDTPPVHTSSATIWVHDPAAFAIVTSLTVSTDQTFYEINTRATATATLVFAGASSQMSSVRFDWHYPDGTLAFMETVPVLPSGTASSRWVPGVVGNAFWVNATYTGIDPQVGQAFFDVVLVAVQVWKNTNVTGPSETWYAAESPIGVCSNITVLSGATLQVEAGVIVRFCRDAGLYVDGSVIMDGNVLRPVLLTSYEFASMPGDWLGVRFSDIAAPRSLVRYVQVRFVTTGIRVEGGAQVSLANVTVVNASRPALDIARADLTVSGSVFSNAPLGVLAVDSVVRIQDVTVSRTDVGVHLENSTSEIRGGTFGLSVTGVRVSRGQAEIRGTDFVGNLDRSLDVLNGAAVSVIDSRIDGGNHSVRSSDSYLSVTRSQLSGARLEGMDLLNTTAAVDNSTVRATQFAIRTIGGPGVTVVNSTVEGGWAAGWTNYSVVFSRVDVMNFLHVLVRTDDGTRLAGALVRVTRVGFLVESHATDTDGWVRWILLTDTTIVASPVKNVYAVTVTATGFSLADSPRAVEMALSHTQMFIATGIPFVADPTPRMDLAILLSLAAILTAGLLAVPIARRRRRDRGTRVLPSRARVVSLEKGNGYLLPAERPDEAFRIFADEVQKGSKGIVVSRIYPQEVRRKFRVGPSPVVWLSRGYGKDTVNPTNLGALVQEIERFVTGKEDSIVLFDGVEYLIVQNDFQKVVKFVQTLRDAITMHGSRLLMPVNLNAFDETKRALLSRDLRIL